MRRNHNSGIYSNNSIRYNMFADKKTKNIVYGLIKINCNKIYNLSNSNKTEKMLNHREKYYRITSEDF
jgi:hypothetical protein